MTRKISKEEKRRRKMEWQFEQTVKTLTGISMASGQAAIALQIFGHQVTGKTPHYNWPETPERSRMHAMYARKKGRAQ